MENSIITVVVPVYNVSKYLRACVDSILSQTYIYLDIILVDDGSTDNSGVICDEYQKIDCRIRVFHKRNGGLSSARNVGIDNAKGKYITFIDSDDYVGPSYVELLYRSIMNKDSQISMCDFLKVEENKELQDVERNSVEKYKEIILTPDDAIKNVYFDKCHGVDFVAWAKLYMTELFIRTKIRYPEGKLHEDTFTTYKLFYEAEKLSYIDIPLYYYRIREGSIMTAEFNLRRLDMLEATRGKCDFLRKKGNNEILTLAFTEHLHNMKLMLTEMIKSPNIDNNAVKAVCEDLKCDLENYRDCVSFKRYFYYRGLASMPWVILRILSLKNKNI